MNWTTVAAKATGLIAAGAAVLFLGLVLVNHGRTLRSRGARGGTAFIAGGAVLLACLGALVLWRIVVAGPDCQGAGPLLC